MIKKKERIHWVDICKGVLIMLLMFSHLVWMSKSQCGIHNVVIDNIANVDDIWNCFFMACFFVLTGMFSNYDKPFKNFLTANIKSLIIPGLVYLLILNLPKLNFYYIIYRTVFFGGVCWFLTSLFLSKMILWVALKYLRIRWIVLFLLLCLSFLGKLLDDINITPNYWYHKNLLNFCLFLAVGYYFKAIIIKRISGIISTVFFLLTIFAFYSAGSRIPNVVSIFHEELWQHPITVWLSITGSITCIHLCMLIRKCAILEYLGRNSLIIYIYHMCFMGSAVHAVIESMNDGLLIHSAIIVFMIIVGTLTFCSGLSEIINTKWCRWMKGAF